MATRPDKIKIIKSKRTGQFHTVRVAPNGRIRQTSEPIHNEVDALSNAKASALAAVVDPKFYEQ